MLNDNSTLERFFILDRIQIGIAKNIRGSVCSGFFAVKIT